MKYRRFFLKSITGKITLVLLATLIPIICFSIVVSGFMVRTSRQQIYGVNENELALFMNQVDEDLNDTVDGINLILKNNWSSLFQADQSNDLTIASYSCWTQLRDQRSMLPNAKYAYLKSGEETISITYEQNDNSYLDSMDIRAYIQQTSGEQLGNREFIWVNIGEKDYFLYNVNVYQFSIGILLDVEAMLAPLKLVNESDEIVDIFADAQGNRIYAAHISEISDEDSGYHIISCKSGVMEYQLERIISEEAIYTSLPFLQRCLQLISILSILIIPIIWLVMKRIVLTPMKRLDDAMHEIEESNIDFRLESEENTMEFVHMTQVFNNMADQIQNLTIEAYEKDIEKLEIEATNLRLQVSPHMLMNSFNMIYNLAQSKNYECIQEFTMCLTNFFRYTLHHYEGFVKVREEMQFVDSYLGIQRIRFPGAFTTITDIEESVLDEKLPPLLIQNFVENTIKYGLILGKEIEIIIIVKKQDERLTISIVDTGCGIKEETLELIKQGEQFEDKQGKHIGIWNCRRRLKMYYGAETMLNISSSPGAGTQVWMEIPIQKGENYEAVNS